MNRILEGLRIIEGSAFVAAPLCGMTLAQQGADVIRFDPLQGGLDDAHRLAANRRRLQSILGRAQQGKRSLAVDTRSPEGQELVVSLITQPGEGAGIFLTNFPASGWLGYRSSSGAT